MTPAPNSRPFVSAWQSWSANVTKPALAWQSWKPRKTIKPIRCATGRTWGRTETNGLDVPTLHAIFADLLARTRSRMLRHIEALPDGIYTFSDRIDGDGLGNDDVPITVRIEQSKSDLLFDFTGTSPQVRGNVNLTLNATHASVCYCLKALLDPDVPNNDGLLSIPRIRAPAGSLLNATFPASVAGPR